MQLHEYEAKRILSQVGVPVPRGRVAASVDEVRQIADWLGKRVVLKAQVLTGGRGRAGGIRLASDADEAEALAGQMFGMDIHGYVASKILVDEAIEVEQEIYLGVTVDRSAAQPVVVASAEGGIEISEVAHDRPEQVYRIPIDPLLGLRVYQVRELAYDIGLNRELVPRFVPAALGLWQAFKRCEATLVEANPLVVSPGGELFSLNARMLVDDCALFRHPDLSDMWDESQETASERLARRHGINYVRLGGEVGCLSNGAGLAMTTLDLLRLHGVKAANFVDIGISAQAEANGAQVSLATHPKVITGLRLAMAHSARVVLVNIFGGVTRCEEVARGILAAYDELDLDVPLVVRLEGTNREVGYKLLSEASAVHRQAEIHVARSLVDAVTQVAALVQRDQPVAGQVG